MHLPAQGAVVSAVVMQIVGSVQCISSRPVAWRVAMRGVFANCRVASQSTLCLLLRAIVDPTLWCRNLGGLYGIGWSTTFPITDKMMDWLAIWVCRCFRRLRRRQQWSQSWVMKIWHFPHPHLNCMCLTELLIHRMIHMPRPLSMSSRLAGTCLTCRLRLFSAPISRVM